MRVGRHRAPMAAMRAEGPGREQRGELAEKVGLLISECAPLRLQAAEPRRAVPATRPREARSGPRLRRPCRACADGVGQSEPALARTATVIELAGRQAR